MHRHDIVVMGASAGGIAAVSRVLRGLPNTFAGSLFIVLHTSPQARLVPLLERSCALPVRDARDAACVTPGHVVVAPPDQHLLLHQDRMVLSHGPKQNGFRPAIDALFQSAARAYEERVVGVVLSGMLDDGSAGLLAIKQAGGRAVVQDPADAEFGDMPRNALRAVPTEYVLPARIIGHKLSQWVNAPAGKVAVKKRSPLVETRRILRSEADPENEPPGQHTMLTCPECGGALWQRQAGNVLRYACHVGHEYSALGLLDGQTSVVEAALWTALRVIKERLKILTKLAEHVERNQPGAKESRYRVQIREMEDQAKLLRRVLLKKPISPAAGAGRS